MIERNFVRLGLISLLLAGCAHIKKAGKEIKEWYSGPATIKVQSEEADQDLNKAVFIANQKAIQKIQSMGCETSIGDSETYYRKSGNGWVATAVYRVPEGKCKQDNFPSCDDGWTRETSRTQAGGWIWFPGVGTNANLSSAILQAEGSSLNYLYGECQSIPLNTKFNERCITKEEGMYKVHIRASVQQISCNSSSISNRELVTRLISFRAIESKNFLDTSKCNDQNAEGCFLQANKEKGLRNIEMSMAYAEAGCLYKDYYSCGFLGFIHWELGNAADARKYLTIGCEKDELSNRKLWCEHLKELEGQMSKL